MPELLSIAIEKWLSLPGYWNLAPVLVALQVAVQLLDAHAGYASTYGLAQRVGWWRIHHDEALLAPDLRGIFLRWRLGVPICVDDFKPYPISPIFGMAGPVLSAVGMLLSGGHSWGVRAPQILVHGAGSLFWILAAAMLGPGPLGFAMVVAMIANYNYFVLGRHVILENYLTTALAGITCVFALDPCRFPENAPWLAAAAALLALVKVNFPFYAWAYTGCLLVGSGAPWETIAQTALWAGSVFGMVELFNHAVLACFGLARFRYLNLVLAFRQHTGRKTNLLKNLNTPGYRVVLIFLQMWWESMGFSPGRWQTGWRTHAQYGIAAVLAVCCAWGAGMTCDGGARFLAGVGLFLLAFLVASAGVFFYVKRVVSIFPIVTLAVLTGTDALFGGLAGKTCATTAAVVYLMLHSWAQWRLWRQLPCTRSSGLDRYGERLDTDLAAWFAHTHNGMSPCPGTIPVYAHCYALRFMWLARLPRFKSGDDQALANEDIVEWAFREQGKLVLLADRGYPVRPEYMVRLRLLEVYEFSVADADYAPHDKGPLRTWLYEVLDQPVAEPDAPASPE